MALGGALSTRTEIEPSGELCIYPHTPWCGQTSVVRSGRGETCARFGACAADIGSGGGGLTLTPDLQNSDARDRVTDMHAALRNRLSGLHHDSSRPTAAPLPHSFRPGSRNNSACLAPATSQAFSAAAARLRGPFRHPPCFRHHRASTSTLTPSAASPAPFRLLAGSWSSLPRSLRTSAAAPPTACRSSSLLSGCSAMSSTSSVQFCSACCPQWYAVCSPPEA